VEVNPIKDPHTGPKVGIASSKGHATELARVVDADVAHLDVCSDLVNQSDMFGVLRLHVPSNILRFGIPVVTFRAVVMFRPDRRL